MAVVVAPSEECGQVKATQEAARTLKLEVQAFEVRSRNDIENAFITSKKQNPDAFIRNYVRA